MKIASQLLALIQTHKKTTYHNTIYLEFLTITLTNGTGKPSALRRHPQLPVLS